MKQKDECCGKMPSICIPGHAYLPAYSGMTPLESRKMAIALPMTSWMSHPMIAISIMIHISNLGALGYSVLKSKQFVCVVCRTVLQASTCVFDDMQHSVFGTGVSDIC